MLLDPKTDTKIFLDLYKNVKNTKKVKEKVIAQEIKGCLINGTLILDPFQIIIAAIKSITSEKQTTKSIYTEILFNLSITKNITKSLSTFGIQDDDECFLLAYLNEDDGIKWHKEIEGDKVPMSELKGLSDINLIKTYYKISDSEANVIPLIDSVVSRIATKDFLTH